MCIYIHTCVCVCIYIYVLQYIYTVQQSQAGSSGGIAEGDTVIIDGSCVCVIVSEDFPVGQDMEVEDSDVDDSYLVKA